MIETADAIARFERSTRTFLDAVGGAAERAWGLRQTGEAWSLAETVEHVVLADRLVHARLVRLAAAPFPSGAPRVDDATISAGMFASAAPPPNDLAEPKGRFATRAEGIAALVEVQADLVTWARGAAIDLRAYGLPHPVFGMFDGVQWLLFAAAHTDSHLPRG